jgi:hypothetical protein
MNALTEIGAPRRAEAIQVFDPIPALDSGKFEQMQRFASVMARSPLVPATLRGTWEGTGANRKLVPFEAEQVFSNCFLVVNQAVRWGMDPFSVISCCSVIHGRLMYEGKLVAAVLDAKLGIKLAYAFRGTGEELEIVVSGPPLESGGEPRQISGTVRQWRTKGDGSPWSNPADWQRQLRYRGTREWARAYEPAVLLGVYTPDELEAIAEDSYSAPRQGAPAIEPPKRKPREPKPDPIAERQREAEQPKPQPAEEKKEQTLEQQAEADPERERLERLVAEFVANAPHAETYEELEAAGEELEPLMPDLPQELAKQVQEVWEENRKRIVFKPTQEPEPEPQEPAIDTSSPDYVKGVQDAKRGLKSCIRPDIKADEARLAHWRAGWESAKPDASST